MNVLIVCETSFGNTRQVAEAIMAGLESQGHATAMYATDQAPLDIPPDVDLLLIADCGFGDTIRALHPAHRAPPEPP